MEKRHSLKILIGLAALSLCLGLMPLLGLEWFTSVEQNAQDYHISKTEQTTAESRIVLVLGGERSTQELNEWPFSRNRYAELLEGPLQSSRTVVFDILFTNEDTTNDPLLRDAIIAHGNVVLPYVKESTIHRPIHPNEMLREVAAMGYVNFWTDSDNIARHYKMLTVEKDGNGTNTVYPSLVLAGLYTDGSVTEIEENGRILKMKEGEKTVTLPLEEDYSIWKIPVGAEGYPVVELSDVLAGKVPEALFEDALVFVGLSASGSSDIVYAPGEVLYGGKYLADCAWLALTGFQPLEVAVPVQILVSFLFLYAVSLLCYYNSLRISWLIPLGGSVGWFFLSHQLFTAGVAYLPSATVIGGSMLCYMSALILRSTVQTLQAAKEKDAQFYGMIECMVSAIDAKDAVTAGHSQRVSELAEALAQAMGLHKKRVREIKLAGLIHDVGKIGVPEHVLIKPGKFTDEEFALIKKHSQQGYTIMEKAPISEEMRLGILEHHERLDGKGYPHGKTAENLSLAGRIIKVADVYDALVSERQYKPAWPKEKACTILIEGKGTEFDPEVVDVFLQMIGDVSKPIE